MSVRLIWTWLIMTFILLFGNLWRRLLLWLLAACFFTTYNTAKSLETFFITFCTYRLKRLIKNIFTSLFFCPQIIVTVYRTYLAFRIISHVAKTIKNIFYFWIFFILSINNRWLIIFCFKLASTRLTKLFINNAQEIFELISLWWCGYFLFSLIFFV